MSAVATLPITTFVVAACGDRALSEEARTLRGLLNAASTFSGSVGVGEPIRLAQESLAKAYSEALIASRNGTAKLRVEPSTYIYAHQLLRLIPSTATPPD